MRTPVTAAFNMAGLLQVFSSHGVHRPLLRPELGQEELAQIVQRDRHVLGNGLTIVKLDRRNLRRR
eukprot:765632-Hanusia_phi.AAC.4